VCSAQENSAPTKLDLRREISALPGNSAGLSKDLDSVEKLDRVSKNLDGVARNLDMVARNLDGR